MYPPRTPPISIPTKFKDVNTFLTLLSHRNKPAASLRKSRQAGMEHDGKRQVSQAHSRLGGSICGRPKETAVVASIVEEIRRQGGHFSKNENVAAAVATGTILGTLLLAKKLVIRSATKQTNYHHTTHRHSYNRTFRSS
jgi:hypothetical protein